jgi:hypothetical protein
VAKIAAHARKMTIKPASTTPVFSAMAHPTEFVADDVIANHCVIWMNDARVTDQVDQRCSPIAKNC